MNIVNLFIGFTPYHAYFVDKILDQVDGDVYGVFTKGWPKNPRLRRIGFFSVGRFRAVSYVISLALLSAFLRTLWLRNYVVNVYLPHPASLLSNYIFFSDRVASVNIIEDGLANYYDVNSDRVTIGRGVRLLGSLIGLPYRNYSGHLIGYDTGRVDIAYLSRPEEAVCREKALMCGVKNDDYYSGAIRGRILFLDQDISVSVDSGLRQKLLAKMFEMYPLRSYVYFYKRHHDYCDLIDGMEFVDSDLPAEELVDYLKPELVISFCSSALLNLAGRGVSCLSLASRFVSISKDGVDCTLASIFSKLGIECLEADLD